MHRRRFVALLGAAITAARTLRAQQKAMPVIGYLGDSSPYEIRLAAFRQGLGDTGWVEGQNVAIEYHWAEGRYDRLPGMATQKGASVESAWPSCTVADADLGTSSANDGRAMPRCRQRRSGDGPAVQAGVRRDRDEPAAQYGSSPDSPLEGTGFEPSVPPRKRRPWREAPRPTIVVSRDDLCLMAPSNLSVRRPLRQQPRDLFGRAGPMVRIRFPPAASRVNR